LFCLSQCANPPPTPGSGQVYGEVHNELAPYAADLINQPRPLYPVGPHGRRYQGAGVFRIKFDYESGEATRVTAARTTGHLLLDNAAMEALRHWTVQPRSWHKIDVLIRFATSGSTGPPSAANLRPLPDSSPPSFKPSGSRPR
jgi:outer membrane biosynthesis protein TonB